MTLFILPALLAFGVTVAMAMQNMPLQIFCGNIAGAAAIKGILFQVFWLAALIAAGKIAIGATARKVVVQGG